MPVLTIDEVLGQLGADERKLFDSTLAKHPELKAGWLRQDDYSKKLNEFTSKEKELERVRARNEALEAWSDRVVPVWEGLAEKGIVDRETGDELWTTQKAELERQLDEAKKSAVGGEMDAAELDRRVKDIVRDAGVSLSKSEMAALIASEGKKLAEETFDAKWMEKEDHINRVTIPFVGGFATNAAIAALKYQQETGKPWTTETSSEFFKMMGDKKNFDALVVIDEFIAPTKKAKEFEDKDKEIERLRAELNARRNSPNLDSDSIIPQDEQMGALQLMLKQSAEKEGDVESLVRQGVVKSAQELAAR